MTAWIGPVAPADLFFSLITVVEIERGIARQQHSNPVFAQDLANWLDAILRLYGERVLPMTVNIARRWGKLSAQIGYTNLDLGIAATALEHGLTVVTRNVKHYERTGVPVLNPFETHARKR